MKYLIRNFSAWCARYVDQAVDYEKFSYLGLIVTMRDGRRGFFDDTDESFRWLPDDPNNMTEEEYRREFAYRLKFLMRERIITQTRLSEMTGIPQQHISRYCRGDAMPDFYKLNKIARALNCPIDLFRYT